MGMLWWWGGRRSSYNPAPTAPWSWAMMGVENCLEVVWGKRFLGHEGLDREAWHQCFFVRGPMSWGVRKAWDLGEGGADGVWVEGCDGAMGLKWYVSGVRDKRSREGLTAV